MQTMLCTQLAKHKFAYKASWLELKGAKTNASETNWSIGHEIFRNTAYMLFLGKSHYTNLDFLYGAPQVFRPACRHILALVLIFP